MYSMLPYIFLLLFSRISIAIKLVPRETPAVVHAPITRRSISPDEIPSIRGRQAKTVDYPITNEVTLYFANLTIGTPPQNFSLHLDTGSSDLWVNTNQSMLCANDVQYCLLSGEYSANDSSTYKYINSDFNITYLDGSNAIGDFVTDTVRIANVTLDNQQFGIGYTSSKYQGVLGLGYKVNEGFTSSSPDNIYPNIPQAMKDGGFTNSVAYSLWLNDLNATTGSILFGGVDTAKYKGNLQTLPVIPYNGIYQQLVIGMTGIGLDGNANSIASDQSIPVLLDSGTTICYVPQSLSDQLYTEFSVQVYTGAPSGIIDCDAANQDRSVEFSFSTATISVPLSEMVILGGYDSYGGPICLFGVTSTSDGSAVLGDTFLRSAYVVYDLSNNEISLAQTDFSGANTQNIVEIGDGTSAVPMATPVANPVTSATALPSGQVMVINGVSGDVTSTMDGAARPVATAAPLGVAGVVAMLGYNILL